MQLWYGNYGFPVNGALVTNRTEIIRTDNQRPIRWRMYIDAEFYLKGSGPADLSQQEAAVRDALAVPYQDLVLKDDSNARTATRLINSESISGVVITAGPTFQDGNGPEYVTLRTGRFSGYAEYVFRGADRALISYTETLSIQGNGGPVRNWRFPVNTADPIRQQVQSKSLVRYIQQGAAVGHLFAPAKQVPYLDPDLMVNEAAAVMRDIGQPLGRAWINQVTRWTYVFEYPGLLPFNPQLPVL